MSCETGEHVALVGLRTLAIKLCRLNRRVEGGGPLGGPIRSGEQVVLASHSDRSAGLSSVAIRLSQKTRVNAAHRIGM